MQVHWTCLDTGVKMICCPPSNKKTPWAAGIIKTARRQITWRLRDYFSLTKCSLCDNGNMSKVGKKLVWMFCFFFFLNLMLNKQKALMCPTVLTLCVNATGLYHEARLNRLAGKLWLQITRIQRDMDNNTNNHKAVLVSTRPQSV